MTRKAKALEFIDEGYNIKITGRHVEITDSMKDYAMEKLSKIEKLRNRITDITVIMDIQKLQHRVEIIVRVDHVKMARQATSNDMYASIDKAIARLESQLRRYKTKVQDHHALGLSEVDMIVNVLNHPEEEEEFEEEEYEDLESVSPNEQRKIAKQEKRLLKMLTYDEAIAKMEKSKEPFLLFKHEEDQKFKVIYTRPDGQYGIIEPQC